MKKNITLKLDSELLREARMIAAEEGISIGEFLAAKFQEIVRERGSHARARRHALTKVRKRADHAGVRPPARDEFHER